jgi:hypothetical protein
MMNIDIKVQDSLMHSQKFQDSQYDVIDVAEPACPNFLSVVKSSGPVYGNIALLTIKTGSTFYTSTSADTTEIKQAVENRRIIANVKLGLLRTEVVHILWRDSLQKIDIVVGVELGHFQWRGWLGSLILHCQHELQNCSGPGLDTEFLDNEYGLFCLPRRQVIGYGDK